MKDATLHETAEALVTQVFDNGRRGNPKLGCDCVVCFGYCMVDEDVAIRERAGFSGRQAAFGYGKVAG